MKKALLTCLMAWFSVSSMAQYEEEPEYFMVSPDSVHMVDPYFQVKSMMTLKDTLWVESGKHFFAFVSTRIDNGEDYVLPSYVAHYNQKYDVIIDHWLVKNVTNDHILFKLSYRKMEKGTGRIKGGRTVVQNYGMRKDDILGIYMGPGKDRMTFERAESLFYMTVSLIGLIVSVSNQ